MILRQAKREDVFEIVKMIAKIAERPTKRKRRTIDRFKDK